MSATIEITRKWPDPKRWTLEQLTKLAAEWIEVMPVVMMPSPSPVTDFLEWLGKEQA